MLTAMIRSAILFLVLVLAMRVMGKRQVGQFLPYELVVAIMIADVVATPMENIGKPILQGIIPVFSLVIMHSLLSILCMKSERIRGFISGRPSVLVRKGVVQEAELRNLCYSLSDLLEEFRTVGVLNPAHVGTAVLETSGRLSVFPHSGDRPVTSKDMGVATGYEGIPLPLIMDGKIQGENLRLAGLDASWLDNHLKEMGFQAAKDIFLASLDTQGMLLVQSAGVKPRLIIEQAIEADKVVW